MAIQYTMKDDAPTKIIKKEKKGNKLAMGLEDESSFRAIRDAAYDESQDKQFQKDAGSKKNKKKGRKILDDLFPRA